MLVNPRIARRPQRTAPFSDSRGGRPCLDLLLSVQNVSIASFACNVDWDFFCDFQTSCNDRWLTLAMPAATPVVTARSWVIDLLDFLAAGLLGWGRLNSICWSLLGWLLKTKFSSWLFGIAFKVFFLRLLRPAPELPGQGIGAGVDILRSQLQLFNCWFIIIKTAFSALEKLESTSATYLLTLFKYVKKNIDRGRFDTYWI